MKTLIFIILSFFLLFSCQEKKLNHNAYYINSDATETGYGTRDKPWKKYSQLDKSQLRAGDTIYMEGIFNESICIDSLVAGTKEKPVIIKAYGDKKVMINSGNEKGMFILNSRNLKLEGIHLTGSGRKDGNTQDGLSLKNCNSIMISDIITEGYQKSGLHINTSKDIIADGVYAHNNGFCGIYVSGESGRKDTSRDIIIRNSKAENNPGDPTNLTNHSGNGILAGNCTNVTIEYCVATNNGWDMPRVGNGPVGIWAYEVDSVLIQHCIAYRNKTQKGAADGGGFDLDGGVTNTIIQYCLSYENEGAGYGLFQFAGATDWYNNTVRYCISENDGAGSTAHGSVFIWNAMDDAAQLKDCYFYNNTIYNEKGAAVSYETSSGHQGFYFYNNIFVAKDPLILGKQTGSKFMSNNWYGVKSKANSQTSEHTVNPQFKNPGKTTLTDPHLLSSYDAYHISNDSPLHTLGLNLSESFGIHNGGKDFNLKDARPQGIGACQ